METREPRRFTVEYKDGELRIDSGVLELRLEEDDVVVFNFTGVPEGHVPGIFFLSHDFLGPFLNMHQTTDSIVLKGNSGRVDTFQCTPGIAKSMLGEDAPLLAVNSVRIENYSERIRPATHVRVLIEQEEGEDPTVTVDAERIAVNETDVVIWSFVFKDVPDIYRPLLYFEESSGPWGPFRSLSCLPVSELTDEGKVLFRLVGEGITSEVRSYSYSVGVVQVLLGDRPGLGKVHRVEHDPIIDSSGPPHV